MEKMIPVLLILIFCGGLAAIAYWARTTPETNRVPRMENPPPPPVKLSITPIEETFNDINLGIAVNEVLAEREKQNRKWGEQNHSIIEWQGILMEEVGEAAREAVDYHFKNPVKNSWGVYMIATEAEQTARLERYRKELIQTAAVAIQMVECLDRNELA